MDLSVVIVNWNSGKLLSECLSSVYKNSSGLSFEVFVVDNASSDDSLVCLKKFPKVRLIKNKENTGFARANNHAIKKSGGRYVLLLNPDTVVSKGSLKNMVEFLDENENVGVLGCKLLNPDGSPQPSCHAFLTLPHVFFEVSQVDYLFPKNKLFIKLFHPLAGFSLFSNYSNPRTPVEVESVSGACYMIRGKALEKTGLLDEKFFLYHEEMELSYRMRQKGFKVVFYPYASIVHHGKTAANTVQDLVYFERCKSILNFFNKHKPGEVKILKTVMFLSLLLNCLTLVFRKDFKKAFKPRIDSFRLII